MTTPIVRFLQDHPVWAMDPGVLRQLCGVLTRHLSGIKLSAEEILAATADRAPDAEPASTIIDGVAVVPVAGVIAKHADLVNGSSQPRGTAIDTIRDRLQGALANPAVEAILLHVSSPGGSIDGVPELADEIAAADRDKPVVALADGMAASAAYWLAAPARCVLATQAALTGSIGAYLVLVDTSRKHETEGVRVIPVASGPHKTTGLDGAAITPEQVAEVRQIVTDAADLFKAHVVANRPHLAETIDALATGAMFSAPRALDAGLIDAVSTFPEALEYALALAEDPNTPLPLSQETRMFGKVKTEPETAAASEVPSAADILQGERDRVAAIMEALPDTLGEIRQASIVAGHSPQEAKAAAFDGAMALLATQAETHTQALAAEQTARADAEARLGAIAGEGTETEKPSPDDAQPTPEEQVAAEAKAKADEDAPAAFEALVVAKLKANPDGKRSGAIRAAVAEAPDLYEAWLAAQADRRTARLGDPPPQS